MAVVLHRITVEVIINSDMKGKTLPNLFQHVEDAIKKELAAHGLSISGLGYAPKTGDWHCCVSVVYNQDQLKIIKDVVIRHTSQIDPMQIIGEVR